MSELKRASARGVAWNLAQNLTSRVLALVVVSIQSRLIEREAFGSIAIALAVTSLAELLVNQGYGDFITQTRKLSNQHLDTAFWFNIGVGAALTCCVALLALPLANLLDADASAAPVVRWLSLSLLIRSCSIVPTAILTREMQFRTLSLRSLIAAVVASAVAIVAAFKGAGVYSLVIQILVGDLVSTVLLWSSTSWRPRLRLSRASFVELGHFGTPILLATLLAMVSRRFDAFIVGGALGLTMLGVYSLAQRAYQIVLQVLNKSGVDVVFSALSRLADTKEDRSKAVYSVVEITTVLCFPVYIGLAVIAEPTTELLFGPRWSDAAPVLRVFALAGVPFTLSLIHLAIIKSSGRTRMLIVNNGVQLVIYAVLILVLAAHGIVAAAYAYLLSCVLILPLELYLVREALSINLRRYLRGASAAVIATAVMAAAAIPLDYVVRSIHPLLHALVLVVSCAVIYVLVLRVAAPQVIHRIRDIAKGFAGRPASV
jgi:PST family polysaccharide transporter